MSLAQYDVHGGQGSALLNAPPIKLRQQSTHSALNAFSGVFYIFAETFRGLAACAECEKGCGAEK
jgi:hypothetical protein